MAGAINECMVYGPLESGRRDQRFVPARELLTPDEAPVEGSPPQGVLHQVRGNLVDGSGGQEGEGLKKTRCTESEIA